MLAERIMVRATHTAGFATGRKDLVCSQRCPQGCLHSRLSPQVRKCQRLLSRLLWPQTRISILRVPSQVDLMACCSHDELSSQVGKPCWCHVSSLTWLCLSGSCHSQPTMGESSALNRAHNLLKQATGPNR